MREGDHVAVIRHFSLLHAIRVLLMQDSTSSLLFPLNSCCRQGRSLFQPDNHLVWTKESLQESSSSFTGISNCIFDEPYAPASIQLVRSLALAPGHR